jgi:hypothetical protein
MSASRSQRASAAKASPFPSSGSSMSALALSASKQQRSSSSSFVASSSSSATTTTTASVTATAASGASDQADLREIANRLHHVLMRQRQHEATEELSKHQTHAERDLLVADARRECEAALARVEQLQGAGFDPSHTRTFSSRQ